MTYFYYLESDWRLHFSAVKTIEFYYMSPDPCKPMVKWALCIMVKPFKSAVLCVSHIHKRANCKLYTVKSLAIGGMSHFNALLSAKSTMNIDNGLLLN